MTDRALHRLAWGLVVAYLVAVAAQTWLLAQAPPAFPFDARGQLPFAVGNTAFAVVGAVIVTRYPRHAVGWLLIASTMVEAVWGVGTGYAGLAVAQGLAGAQAAAWVAQVSASTSMGIIAVALLLFPTGRVPSRRWRPVLVLAIAATALNATAVGLHPGRLDDYARAGPPLENPFGVAGLAEVDLWPAVYVSTLLALASLVVRYARGTGRERHQVLWVAWATALAILPIVGIALALDRAPEDPAVSTALNLVIAVVITLIPLSIGIAIVRHRLYDIDVLINRTLVYALLTASLVSAYLLGVLGFRALLQPLVGESDLGIAASTLLVAAFFRPVRARIQLAVDRRFYRRKYDAERVLETFGQRLRDRIDLDDVHRDLCGAVDRTVQPTRVGLWTREPTR